jgi:hypothetical protein
VIWWAGSLSVWVKVLATLLTTLRNIQVTGEPKAAYGNGCFEAVARRAF